MRKNYYVELKKLLTTTWEGRTFTRFLKTLVYSAISFYVINRVAPFSVDWLAMFEVSLLAGRGFSLDKGLREFKK